MTEFRFKQFAVCDDNCAQKIGTDGVLLGAWVKLPQQAIVCDIGTGSGLVALMLAQQGKAAHIHAVEIDEAAYTQATDNFKKSPWSTKITALWADFKHLTNKQLTKVNCFVSNPPFFSKDLAAATKARNLARHDENLSLAEILSTTRKIGASTHSCNFIYPFDRLAQIEQAVQTAGYFFRRLCVVRPNVNKAPKRILFEIATKPGNMEEESLVLELERHKWHPDYVALCREFYLNT